MKRSGGQGACGQGKCLHASRVYAGRLVALPSAEAELCAPTTGAAQVLGAYVLARRLRGIGRGDRPHRRERCHRHRQESRARQAQAPKREVPLAQDKVKEEDFELRTAPGLVNPADLMTKHLGRVDADRHPRELGMHLGGGRAATAPPLPLWKRQYNNMHAPAQPRGVTDCVMTRPLIFSHSQPETLVASGSPPLGKHFLVFS